MNNNASKERAPTMMQMHILMNLFILKFFANIVIFNFMLQIFQWSFAMPVGGYFNGIYEIYSHRS